MNGRIFRESDPDVREVGQKLERSVAAYDDDMQRADWAAVMARAAAEEQGLDPYEAAQQEEAALQDGERWAAHNWNERVRLMFGEKPI